MRLSIVVPCHNAEAWLAQTIGSALDQTRPPDELLIVDDGSTDGSLALARQFEDRCGGLVRVHAERSGQAPRTRNIGAQLATGDALMFLDADDVLGPRALEALAGLLSTEPAGFVACAWRRLERADGLWVARPPSCAPRRPGRDVLAAWLGGFYYPPCAVLWSREGFLRAGGWDERIACNQDGDLVMRALIDGVPFLETAAGTAYYRRLPEGRTSLSGSRFRPKGIAGRLRVIEKIAVRLEEQGRLDLYRPALFKAFGLIAEDARGRAADLYAQARSLARLYGPTLQSRLQIDPTAAAGRALPACSAAIPAEQPEEGGTEIRFGLDKAAEVLRRRPDPVRPTAAPAASRPAVSVVIPTFRRPALLARALGSVLNQTFGDFEILVVDDGPSEDTASVTAGLADARVRYLPQPRNRGVAAARNRGLREARGDLIAFLDDDDEWLPPKLARQVDLFRRSPPDVGLVYTGVETVRSAGSSIMIATAGGDIHARMLIANILHGAMSSGMIRRQAVTEIGVFDEALPAVEDYEFWLRLTRRYRVACVPEPLIRYYDTALPAQPGMEGEARRSRKVAANLQGRFAVYRKHRAAMRRANAAHLFLLDNAERLAVAPFFDRAGARRLAAQAVLEAPACRTAWRMLAALSRPPKTRPVEHSRRPVPDALAGE
jgi:glycosyltransferase involved in cell wall biosynthesis